MTKNIVSTFITSLYISSSVTEKNSRGYNWRLKLDKNNLASVRRSIMKARGRNGRVSPKQTKSLKNGAIGAADTRRDIYSRRWRVTLSLSLYVCMCVCLYLSATSWEVLGCVRGRQATSECDKQMYMWCICDANADRTMSASMRRWLANTYTNRMAPQKTETVHNYQQIVLNRI